MYKTLSTFPKVHRLQEKLDAHMLLGPPQQKAKKGGYNMVARFAR